MTFEETLAALHEILGEPIDIMIMAGAPGSPQVTIGFMRGTLLRAVNRGPAVMPDLDAGPEAWNEHDAHFFAVGDIATGFYVSPQAFRDARWLNDERQTLWIRARTRRRHLRRPPATRLTTPPPGPAPRVATARHFVARRGCHSSSIRSSRSHPSVWARLSN